MYTDLHVYTDLKVAGRTLGVQINADGLCCSWRRLSQPVMQLALTAAIKQPGEACAIAFLQTDNPGQSSDALTRRKSASCNQLPTRLGAVPQRSRNLALPRILPHNLSFQQPCGEMI